MTRLIAFYLVLSFLFVAPASAQQQVFIQIEAQPSLAQAQQSLRGYAERFQDLNGFALRSGWFGIALGPYPEDEAATILRNLRAARRIPRDSYIAREADFRAQFWPSGVSRLPRAADPEAPADGLTGDTLPEAEEAGIIAPRESLREARAGEAQLDRAGPCLGRVL